MKIVVPEFGVCHVNDAAVQPAKQVDSLLAVSCPPIFRRDDGVIEYLFTAIKIQPVPAEVGFALPLVPGDHPVKA